MDEQGKINVAVIGLGWVASNRHTPIILQNRAMHLYGVVDKRLDRIESIKKKYPWLQTSLSQAGDMPWEGSVQAVLIATDPLNHFSLAKKMLELDKHVLMEKPFTMSVDEAVILQKIAKERSLTCSVVHNFQFSRSALKLKAMIVAGRLGSVESIEAIQLSNPRRRLPTWYEQLPFGLFYDESPHLLYMLDFFAGRDVRRLSSTVVESDRQHTPLSVSASYAAGGMPIRLSMNFNASVSEWHIAVMGTKGVGIVDLFRDILVVAPNDGLHRAREILMTSGSTVATHLKGFIQSGVLLARGKLFYGADVVWEKFLAEILRHEPAVPISAERGIEIVRQQHELMTNSDIVKVTADESLGH